MVRNRTTVRRLKYYLGTNTSHMVYEVEAVAVILALHLVANINNLTLTLIPRVDGEGWIVVGSY